MSTAVDRAPVVFGEARNRDWRQVVWRALLACGAVSSLLYIVATDGIGAAQWESYNRTTRMVSDLFAIGSPARPLLLVFTPCYTLLLIAFGIGLASSSHASRSLRLTGYTFIAYGLANVVASCFPLTLGVDASVPMHIVATNVLLVLMLAAIGFGAAAFRGRFRTYSLATVATTIVAGLVAFASAPGGPSLWLGIGERIAIWTFLAWVVVLAVVTWQVRGTGSRLAGGQRRRSLVGRMYDWVYERCSDLADRRA